jgi:PAS domain S-box-containing protein
MNNENKTKEQLLRALKELQEKVKKLEESQRMLSQPKPDSEIDRQKYQLFFQKSSDIIFTVDAQFKISNVSPSVETFSGYTPEELIGKSIKDLNFLTPESLKNMAINIQNRIQGKGDQLTEYEFITKDGDKKFAEVNATPVFQDGNFVETVAIARDITDRITAERKQKQSERNYQRLIDNISDVIVELDTEGNFIYLSPQVSDIFGYEPAEMFGINAFQQIHPDDLDVCLDHFENALFERKIITVEYRALHKDGNYVTVSARGGLVEDNGNKKFIGIIRDISERKDAEQKMLEERNRAEFYLDLLGHDINNLNQAVVSYNEMLTMEEELPDKYKRYSQNSLNQALAISDLIYKVQRLSELQKVDFNLKSVNLVKIISDVEKRLQLSFPDKKISINKSIQEPEINVKGVDLLHDAFLNIMGNAIKFNQNDEILMDVSIAPTDDGSWKIEFKDYGPGITDEYKERIFKRLERGLTKVYGSGLGLTIVNEIISRCNGKIWVEDRITDDSGKGSNFVVLLPKEG